jgi:hypothetical protein
MMLVVLHENRNIRVWEAIFFAQALFLSCFLKFYTDDMMLKLGTHPDKLEATIVYYTFQKSVLLHLF